MYCQWNNSIFLKFDIEGVVSRRIACYEQNKLWGELLILAFDYIKKTIKSGTLNILTLFAIFIICSWRNKLINQLLHLLAMSHILQTNWFDRALALLAKIGGRISSNLPLTLHNLFQWNTDERNTSWIRMSVKMPTVTWCLKRISQFGGNKPRCCLTMTTLCDSVHWTSRERY